MLRYWLQFFAWRLRASRQAPGRLRSHLEWGIPYIHRAMVLHALDGRVRVKLRGAKGDHVRARVIEERMVVLHGVYHAHVNPLTGNALVLYDAERTDAATIIDVLRVWGYYEDPAHAAPHVDDLGTTILRATAELAIQRVLMALLVA